MRTAALAVAALLSTLVGPSQVFSSERYKAAIGRSPVRCLDDALVTMVVCADYQCLYCAQLLPVLDQILAQHRGAVRLAWRQKPLAMHPEALVAAEAALAAREQGRFWPMNALLLDHQDALKADDL